MAEISQMIQLWFLSPGLSVQKDFDPEKDDDSQVPCEKCGDFHIISSDLKYCKNCNMCSETKWGHCFQAGKCITVHNQLVLVQIFIVSIPLMYTWFYFFFSFVLDKAFGIDLSKLHAEIIKKINLKKNEMAPTIIEPIYLKEKLWQLFRIIVLGALFIRVLKIILTKIKELIRSRYPSYKNNNQKDSQYKVKGNIDESAGINIGRVHRKL